jgi:hypothetical protein
MIIERRAYRWLASPIRSIVHGRQIPESLVPKECEHPRPSQLSKRTKQLHLRRLEILPVFGRKASPKCQGSDPVIVIFLIRGNPALCGAGVEVKRDGLNSPN